ncbi:MAG: glycoside hydrolase family 15 protein, partial [Acidimicrobiales bacterium]
AGAASTWVSVGFAEEAETAESWGHDAGDGSALPGPSALDVEGAAVPTPASELELDGWRRSQPVVVGRGGDRFDLDLYGDVVRAISASAAASGSRHGPLVGAWPALAGATDWLSDHWAEPDHGVWGLEGGPEMLVSSRLSAWAALDRMARLGQDANPLDLAAAAWWQEAGRVLSWLEREAIAPHGGLRRGGPPSPAQREAGPDERPDAALLRVAWQGPWPAGHPVVARTVDRVLERLSVGAFVYRYGGDVDDGRPGADNPDLEASLWAVRALASLERWEQAHERFEAICGAGGELGVLSQAFDPLSRELMGNLPATGAHLALVDAAVALASGPR